MKKTLKKLLSILLLTIFVLALTACDLPLNNDEYEMVTDEEIKNGLLQYNLGYQTIVPGKRDGEYSDLLQNEYGRATYLTKYTDQEDGYYLVYVKQSVIDAHQDVLEARDQLNGSNPNRNDFTQKDEVLVVEGKHLYLMQNSGEDVTANTKVVKVDTLEEIKLKYESNYRLALCAQARHAVIKENVTAGTTINKEIVVFRRVILEFADKNATPTVYDEENALARTQLGEKRRFEFEGEVLENFHESYEQMATANYPYVGNASAKYDVKQALVITDGTQKYVVLPRSIVKSDGDVDLFDEEHEYDWDENDVYGEHKAEFSDAFIRLTTAEDEIPTSVLDANYTYGLFDYDEVCDIIEVE